MELLNQNIVEYTWANKPSVAPLGQIICITDVGVNGSLWRGNGTKWFKMGSFRYYDLTATSEVTATTAETTLLTIPIKGGVVGQNGKLIVYAMFSFTNNANQKIPRLKYNSDLVWTSTVTTGTTACTCVPIHNFNSEAVQKTATGILAGVGLTSSAIIQATIDTSADFNLVITGQLANSADFLKLEALFLELM